MYFRQLRLSDIGCASYIVGGDGVCAVIDPRWDVVPQYTGLAGQQGLKITHIIDTHTHADHVSGASRLADRTGATVYIHRQAQTSYPHQDVDDGDEIPVGPARILIMHTPGHSMDSISLLVRDAEGNDLPRLLSGDTIFVGEVGRPDLHGAEAAGLAELLYASLHERVLQLDDHVEVFPGHLAGSLCGRRILPEPSTTVGRERNSNPVLSISDREAFVQAMISDLPPRPPNVQRIVQLNRLGAPTGRPNVARVAPNEAAALLKSAVVVDGRDVNVFARGHVWGALNVPISYGQFGVMVAWMLSPEMPLLLIANDDEDLTDAVNSLMALGMTNPLSALGGGPEEWKAAGLPVLGMKTVSAERLHQLLAEEAIGSIVDSREPGEVEQQGTIAGSINLPYRTIRSRETLPPLVEPVVPICNSSNRSGLAASLLERLGIRVMNLDGGTSAWEEAGYPLVRPVVVAG
jgi:hydroxyacylglutathione hydrolase